MEGNSKDSSSTQEEWTMENPGGVEVNNEKQETFSDSESVNYGGGRSNLEESWRGMFGSDFIRLDEKDELHLHIKERFLKDLEGFDLKTQVVSIHKNCCLSSYWQGKIKAFQSYIKAHEEIGGNIGNGNGNANLRQAWFSASKAQIVSILSRGYFSEATHNGIYGRGVYLSPHHLTIDCLQSCVPDENGVRYMVFCRVIMGEMEIIRPISKQNCSSSNEYHSGVDDLFCPTKYIIWNGQMNTHIFPVFVISFKSSSNTNLSSNNVVSRAPSKSKKPRSPWIPLPMLIDALSKVLPEYTMRLLRKHHLSFMEKRISREEIIKKFRDMVGDKLLVEMIKAYRYKFHGSPTPRPSTIPSHNQNK